MTRNSLVALFWIAAVTCVTSQLILIRAVIAVGSPGRRPRTSQGVGVTMSGQSPYRGSARWKEIAWVVLPALALLAVLVATWQALNVPGVAGSGARFLS